MNRYKLDYRRNYKIVRCPRSGLAQLHIHPAMANRLEEPIGNTAYPQYALIFFVGGQRSIVVRDMAIIISCPRIDASRDHYRGARMIPLQRDNLRDGKLEHYALLAWRNGSALQHLRNTQTYSPVSNSTESDDTAGEQ